MESGDTLQAESFDLQASSQGMLIPASSASAMKQLHFATPTSATPESGSPVQSETIAKSNDTSSLIPDGQELNFPILRERFEKEFIIKALTAYRGRINQTAEATQMTKVTLLRKLEKYGIDAKDYFKI
jgi:DNA-binding NtrC family response regulator